VVLLVDLTGAEAQHIGKAIHLSLQHPKITGLVDVIESSEAQRDRFAVVIDFDDL